MLQIRRENVFVTNDIELNKVEKRYCTGIELTKYRLKITELYSRALPTDHAGNR